MSRPVKKIVIVGGGTAGWITAGVIASTHTRDADDGLEITLVESPNIPQIGVGEGTWPSMRDTLRKMGVSETEFIRECSVGFKQGAWFANWRTNQPGEGYYHPLMLPQGFLQGNLVPEWSRREGEFESFAHAVSTQADICDSGLAPKQFATPEFAAVQNYAYHLDAGAYSGFLQRHCTEKLGVKHVLADVVDVVSAENGDISAVTTEQAGDIEGDLFVDCTGFRSRLLGEHYKVGFRDLNHILFIDKALAVQVPYLEPNDPIACHTISTGQTAGWIWDIGLYNRRGVGHVYSSNHTTEDAATDELEQYLKQSGHDLKTASVRKIDIRSGHRERFWERNCVAVGLSAGFLEPLEASALVLIELSSRMIAEQMPVDRAAMDIVAKRFNRKFRYRWDRIVDFLKLHYVLTERSDSDFWVDNLQADSIPESLMELLELWKYQPPFHDDFDQKDEVFPSASYQYVLYGMHFSTIESHLGTSSSAKRFADMQFAQKGELTSKLQAGLPHHRELLDHIHAHGLPQMDVRSRA